MYCWNNTFINIIITLYEHIVVDYYCCNLKTICFRFLSTQRTLGKLNYKVTIHKTDHNLLLISIVDIILLSILLLHYMNILLLIIIVVSIKETWPVDILTEYQYTDTKTSYFKNILFFTYSRVEWSLFLDTSYSWVPNRRVYSFIRHQRNMKKETDTKTDKSI